MSGLKITSIVLTFIWCLFMGVTAISIGFGALYPPMNRIAAPFVCANGEMRFEQTTSRPLPGTTYVLTAWYCVDGSTGRKTELDIFPMALYAGLIYGFILFVVVFIGMIVLANRRASKQGEQNSGHDAELDELLALEKSQRMRGSDNQEDSLRLTHKTEAATDATARMAELKKLRDANLISDAEYEGKRAEILREL